MLMTEYETTVVMRPDVSGDAIEATLDRVRNAVQSTGGKLLSVNHWGKKKMAYEIGKNSRGVYVNAHYLGKGPLVAEVERNLRISDTVMRFLTVKLDERVNPADREIKSYVRPEYNAATEVEEEEQLTSRHEMDYDNDGYDDRGDRGDRGERGGGAGDSDEKEESSRDEE